MFMFAWLFEQRLVLSPVPRKTSNRLFFNFDWSTQEVRMVTVTTDLAITVY